MSKKKKLIVTHYHPDMDAIVSSWFLIKFLSGEYGDASFAFVPAGETYRKLEVDSDPDVVHVDTGLGKYDHHDQEREALSATKLVYDDLRKKQAHLSSDKALGAIVDFVTEIDHFGEYYWPDALNPRYVFMLSTLVPRLHHLEKYSNEEVMEMVFPLIDASYGGLKDYYRSIKDVEKGRRFDSMWGKGLVVESGSDGIMKIAQKKGFKLVVRKNPASGYLKIKATPSNKIDLKILYDRIVQTDGAGLWYYHPSGNMLINGSAKNAQCKPSSFSTSDLVQLIEEVSAGKSN